MATPAQGNAPRTCAGALLHEGPSAESSASSATLYVPYAEAPQPISTPYARSRIATCPSPDRERSGDLPHEEFRPAAIAANSALKNQGLRNENFHANAFGGGWILAPAPVRDAGSRASAASNPQFPHHDLRSGPGSYQEAWPDSADHR